MREPGKISQFLPEYSRYVICPQIEFVLWEDIKLRKNILFCVKDRS